MKQKTVQKNIRYGGDYCKMIVNYGIDFDFARKNNQAPYFSITADIYKANKSGAIDKRYRDNLAGGCLHDEILKAFPKMADLVSFHLRHADGSPGLAVENGLFMVECCLGLNTWNNFTVERCQQWTADHFMCSVPEVLELCEQVAAAKCTIFSRPPKGSELAPMPVFTGLGLADAQAKVKELNAEMLNTPKFYYIDKSEAKAVVSELVNELRPKWEAAADILIQKYDLGEK